MHHFNLIGFYDVPSEAADLEKEIDLWCDASCDRTSAIRSALARAFKEGQRGITLRNEGVGI